jgi:N utilization substance protein A
MTSFKLDENQLRYINTFFTLTNVEVMEVAENDENIFFIIYPNTLRRAIDKNGEKVKKIKDMLNKNIIIVEYSDDIERFVYNLFYRFNVKDIKIEKIGDSYKINVKVDPANKARAIGKNGRNLKTTKEILDRHFKVLSLYVD